MKAKTGSGYVHVKEKRNPLGFQLSAENPLPLGEANVRGRPKYLPPSHIEST